jgi:hypothetical protein
MTILVPRASGGSREAQTATHYGEHTLHVHHRGVKAVYILFRSDRRFGSSDDSRVHEALLEHTCSWASRSAHTSRESTQAAAHGWES